MAPTAPPLQEAPAGWRPRWPWLQRPPLTPLPPHSEHGVGEDIYDCVPCEDDGDDIYEDIIRVEVQQPMVSPARRAAQPLPDPTVRPPRGAPSLP